MRLLRLKTYSLARLSTQKHLRGTEEIVLVAEVDIEDDEERLQIADNIRQHLTQNTAIALRNVHLIDPRWIQKTSSGKKVRSASEEKYLQETRLENTAKQHRLSKPNRDDI